jgi:peptidoglycan/LPS O-acetylase OafA/YrhL
MFRQTSTSAALPRSEGRIRDEQWWSSVRERIHRSHIPGLDGIRAVAVFLVIGYHFGLEWIDGAMGVTMFFGLSGFLITWLLLKEHESAHVINLKAFYCRRTFRIFPAFYAFWLFTGAVYLLRGHDLEWGVRISSAFYASNYYLGLTQGGRDSVLNHTWSLAVEEQFYVLWPMVVVLARGNTQRLTKVLSAIIVTIWMWRPLLYLGYHVDASYIYHAFDTRADALMVGCLLAVVLRRGVLIAPLRRLCSHVLAPFVSLALLAASSYLTWSDPSGRYSFTIGYALEPLVIAVFIVQMIALTKERTWRWFEHPVMLYLGRISYSLYLYQQITLFTARRMTESVPVAIQLAFAIAVTAAFASVSYVVIEKPFLAVGRKLILRMKHPLAADQRPAAAHA